MRQGEAETLTVEAEDNVMSLIETEVRGDNLTLKFDTGLFRTIIPRKGIKYFLTLASPRKVTISGSGSLDVQISGSGEILYRGNPRISQRISGSGKITEVY